MTSNHVGQGFNLSVIRDHRRQVANLPRSLVLSALIVAWTSCVMAADPKPSYPSTRKDNVVEKLHGKEIVDPYRWLEDGKASEVKEWTDKQNDLTKSILDKLPSRDAIHK